MNSVEVFGSNPYHLLPHVPEVEIWAKLMCKKFPQTNEEIVLLASWLHDIGHYPISPEIDHAIRGEEISTEFLVKENYDPEKTKNVLHCIRSHRCRDIQPETFEAKVLAFIDSASHMTKPIYFDMAEDLKPKGKINLVYEKIQRDYRDLSTFPEIQKELAPLHDSWKNLIKTYENLDY